MDQRADCDRNHDREPAYGRILAPPMPVESFKHLNHSDALAIAAYLKSLPAVKNKVPGPFGPTEKPTSFMLQVLPPDKYTPTPPPPGPPASGK